MCFNPLLETFLVTSVQKIKQLPFIVNKLVPMLKLLLQVSSDQCLL